MSFFFPTPVEKKIETTTSEMLPDVDYAAHMEIWDLIRSSQDGGKEVLKAIKVRMGSKTAKVAYYSLMLLESSFKNTGIKFHECVAHKDFLPSVVKITAKKGLNPDISEKALALIQSWAEAYPKSSKLPVFFDTYTQLREKGAVFPARDASAQSPVFTPPATVKPKPVEAKAGASSAGAAAASGAASSGSRPPLHWISPEFVIKTKMELQVTMNYVKVLREMLIASQQDQQRLKSDPTISTLVHTHKEIMTRLNRLIVEVDHEQLLDLCIKVMEQVRIALEFHTESLRGGVYQLPEMEFPAGLLDVSAPTASAGGGGGGGGGKPVLDLSAFDQKAPLETKRDVMQPAQPVYGGQQQQQQQQHQMAAAGIQQQQQQQQAPPVLAHYKISQPGAGPATVTAGGTLPASAFASGGVAASASAGSAYPAGSATMPASAFAAVGMGAPAGAVGPMYSVPTQQPQASSQAATDDLFAALASRPGGFAAPASAVPVAQATPATAADDEFDPFADLATRRTAPVPAAAPGPSVGLDSVALDFQFAAPRQAGAGAAAGAAVAGAPAASLVAASSEPGLATNIDELLRLAGVPPSATPASPAKPIG